MKDTLAKMHWLNEPEWELVDHTLVIKTHKDTDYWQRTHYGFRRDNAHACLQPIPGDCLIRAHLRFASNAQYDQCGLLLRVDEDCWFKCSVEYENEHLSRLGSVATNYGYSDWATQDISAQIHEIWYEIELQSSDLILRNSFDGQEYRQMRIAHLHTQGRPIEAGFYGCSPVGDGFQFTLLDYKLEAL